MRVGSDESNLELSDRRAETVAKLLTDLYDVPPENLATQGYGERYLKVETESEERANRRATVRRITPLVAPVAQQPRWTRCERLRSATGAFFGRCVETGDLLPCRRYKVLGSPSRSMARATFTSRIASPC